MPKLSGAEVNVTPLLDVVFCILAVFMLLVAGLSVPKAIGVDLPSRSSPNQATPLNSDLLVLTLDQAGNLAVDGKPLTPSKLEQQVKGFLAAKPQGLVVLNAADQTVSYQLVVNQLANLRDLAGDRVAIATSVQQNQSQLSQPGR